MIFVWKKDLQLLALILLHLCVVGNIETVKLISFISSCLGILLISDKMNMNFNWIIEWMTNTQSFIFGQ